MWENNDKNNYHAHILQNKGQISNDRFSEVIKKYAKDLSNKTFLEIGTWNGLGSTKQFVDMLKTRNDEYIFYSLECNSDKCNDAKKLYVSEDKVHILNEVLFNDEPNNFHEIFPQCISNEMYKEWHRVDMGNMKKCNIFLERTDLPKIFDVVLLDGGEFTTYFEYQLIKDRCRYLLLDDINVAKCTKIVEEIKSEPTKWEVIEENRYTRNGFLVCKNLNNVNPSFLQIISVYKSDISWTKNLIGPYRFFYKDSPQHEPFNNINICGAETNILKFIITFYYNLPDICVFTHPYNRKWTHRDNLYDRVNELFLNRSNLKDYGPLHDGAPYIDADNKGVQYDYMISTGWWKTTMEPYFGKMPEKYVVGKYSGAQFYIRKETAWRLPIEFYKNMYMFLVEKSNPNSLYSTNNHFDQFWTSRFMEWSWQYIFTAKLL
jgi:hypothetical protein